MMMALGGMPLGSVPAARLRRLGPAATTTFGAGAVVCPAASSSPSTSAIEPCRSAGSRASIFSMQCASAPGASGFSSRTGVRASDRIFGSSSASELATNGVRPHSRWYRTAPSE